MKTKQLYQKVLSLVLAMAMIVTVFAVSGPAEVSAAATKKFNGKGKSSVKITDEECVDLDAMKYRDHYIQFKPSVTGYITLTFKPLSVSAAADPRNTTGYIQLCDSKKKAITEDEVFDTYSDYGSVCTTKTYGVEKGKTYYFSVMSKIGIQISANVVKVAKSKGTSKAKAVALKQKKKTEGVIYANTKGATWYKIKLTKATKLQIDITAKTHGLTLRSDSFWATGGIKVTFLDKNGKKWGTGTGAFRNMTVNATKAQMQLGMINTVTGEISGIPKGTYYVKVEPSAAKKFSGEYTLKWSTFK